MNALNTAHAEQSPGKTRINIEDPMAASTFAWIGQQAATIRS